MEVSRIILTDKAAELIDRLKKMHGPLMFHQSGGCCDGSQPMCFSDGEFKTGGSDVCLGSVDGCRFYMSNDQFEYLEAYAADPGCDTGQGQQLFAGDPTRGAVFYPVARI